MNKKKVIVYSFIALLLMTILRYSDEEHGNNPLIINKTKVIEQSNDDESEKYNHVDKYINKLDVPDNSLDIFLGQNRSDDKIKVFLDEYNKLIVTMTNNDYTLNILFDYGGINAIYGISKIIYNIGTKKGIGTIEDARKELTVGTDWIGPYMINCIKNNENQDVRFTGGWHGTEEDGQGDKTAYTDEVIITYVDHNEDEQELTPLEQRECTKIMISVTNYINAYNTNYPVLKEKAIYMVSNGKISVRVGGIALEEIEIVKYYGLQSQNSLYDGNIKYIYANDTYKLYPSDRASCSLCKNKNEVKAYELSSSDGLLSLSVGLSNKGIGDFSYVSDGVETCFTTDYGKSYFNLVNGKKMALKTNDDFFWEGYYLFF